jgi:uncharacterized protein
MKTIIIGEAGSVTMETIMSVYPRHVTVLDKYIQSGEIIGVGPFADKSGNMAIFKTREAAEQFVAEDPFALEGVIKSYVIRGWEDDML